MQLYKTRTASQKIMRCAGGIETFVMQKLRRRTVFQRANT